LRPPHPWTKFRGGEVSGQNIENPIWKEMKAMKVIFGDLDEMLSELREKEISDVRIEALYDERYSKQGVPFLKVYVTAQALLSPTLYAYYERVTFRGVKPFSKEELRSLFDENLEAKEEIKEHVADSRFWVRSGHFQEE
jgi:hypothetical protein